MKIKRRVVVNRVVCGWESVGISYTRSRVSRARALAAADALFKGAVSEPARG